MSSLQIVEAGRLCFEFADVYPDEPAAEGVAQVGRTPLVERDMNPAQAIVSNVECDASVFCSGDGELRIVLDQHGFEFRYISHDGGFFLSPKKRSALDQLIEAFRSEAA